MYKKFGRAHDESFENQIVGGLEFVEMVVDATQWRMKLRRGKRVSFRIGFHDDEEAKYEHGLWFDSKVSMISQVIDVSRSLSVEFHSRLQIFALGFGDQIPQN